MENLLVLGSTGSIGVNTLDVAARHPERYRVFALTASTNVELMLQQCLQFQPAFAVLVDAKAAADLRQQLKTHGSATEVLDGSQALEEIAAHTEVDTVMAAIVGGAGLPASIAAARAGKKILLANKEALVMAGPLFMQAVREHNAQLLPIDSEHNAIFQCLQASSLKEVRKILLTGSGGPFRQWPVADMAKVTPAQACAHPNWTMGQKISVDSASMMNKGLELIEACLLFECPESLIEVVVHPQSVIHSMVEYVDGSVLAQLGNPDMRTPIAYGLAWPERIESGVPSLDIIATARLDFEAPDYERFPALVLAREAARQGGLMPAVMSAANEEAVAAFLAGGLAFTAIVDCVQAVLEQASLLQPADSLELIYQADAQARQLALTYIQARSR